LPQLCFLFFSFLFFSFFLPLSHLISHLSFFIFFSLPFPLLLSSLFLRFISLPSFSNLQTSSNFSIPAISVRRGVSKSRLTALPAGHPRNGCKAVSGLACPQGIKRLGMTARVKL
jgi:hypothetical protein